MYYIFGNNQLFIKSFKKKKKEKRFKVDYEFLKRNQK